MKAKKQISSLEGEIKALKKRHIEAEADIAKAQAESNDKKIKEMEIIMNAGERERVVLVGESQP